MLRQDNLITDIHNYDNIIKHYVNENDMHIFKTNRVKNIINKAKTRLVNSTVPQRPIIPLFLTFWSDDFDPNKSIKNNRQSVWIKTMTIFSIDIKGNKISSTYPLTLAMKGKDHDIVEKYYMRQILSLREGELISMFSTSHKAIVHVHADIFCVMNDQPERRGNLNLCYGNSAIHGRFGILMDCKQVKDGIRSCMSCTKSIIEEAMSTIKRKLIIHHFDLYVINKCTNKCNLNFFMIPYNWLILNKNGNASQCNGITYCF